MISDFADSIGSFIEPISLIGKLKFQNWLTFFSFDTIMIVKEICSFFRVIEISLVSADLGFRTICKSKNHTKNYHWWSISLYNLKFQSLILFTNSRYQQ